MNSNLPAIAIWGTGSNVGKSVFAAGLCRWLANRGLNVAPFKAQNMSNNSGVTKEGGEIGRAQIAQAEACRIQPTCDMNPLLLKPSGDQQSQVILQGNMWGSIGSDFGEPHLEYWKEKILESYHRLAVQSDCIVIEGAGSCAELNLRHRDLANLWIADTVNAKVILVADIERGGIFASVLGTLDLLGEHRNRVIGVVVNKFRGNAKLFEAGIDILQSRGGIPVLGVLPYLKDLQIADEDSLAFDERTLKKNQLDSNTTSVGVIAPAHLSNSTDVEALLDDSRFDVEIIRKPNANKIYDVLVIPGSKTVIPDLMELKRNGFAEYLHAHYKKKNTIIGVCGGYQMLGKSIRDPDGIESSIPECEGFGLLNVSTTIQAHKQLKRARGIIHPNQIPVQGYEIHCGTTEGNDTKNPLLQLQYEETQSMVSDGAISKDGLVMGSYLHGFFDAYPVRTWLASTHKHYSETNTNSPDPYDFFAGHIEKHLNLELILNYLGEGSHVG